MAAVPKWNSEFNVHGLKTGAYISCIWMSEISLPVSLGEALDKLTILDIKCSKIADSERSASAKKEYDILYAILKEFVRKYAWHYKVLREVNLAIWDQQDKFHGQADGVAKPTEVELGQICSVILDENDRRFRVKAKINHITSSTLREVKGYAKKKAFLYGHLGLGDMFWLNGAVRWLSTCYDEVLVVCKKKYGVNVEALYADDPTIKFHMIEDDAQMEPFFLYHRGQWESKGYTVYACGNHLINPFEVPTKPWIYEFPHCFYDDLKIPRLVRQDYFYIPTNPESDALVRLVKRWSSRYIIVHQQSQNKHLEIWDKVARSGTQEPIFDLNENHYDFGHPFYILAEMVVNKPLYMYKGLLEQAAEIHLLESSVYCMASHLDLSGVAVKKCYDAFEESNTRIGVFETATL